MPQLSFFFIPYQPRLGDTNSTAKPAAGLVQDQTLEDSQRTFCELYFYDDL